MPIVINNLKIKVVIQFTHASATLNQVTTFFNNTIRPDLNSDLTSKLDANFEPGYIVDGKVTVIKKGTTFEIYPKVLVNATTNTLTANQLRTGFDNMMNGWKTIVGDHLTSQGASNIVYHLHKSTGAVNE